ncbi:hypothetical protein BSM4216_2538 [Bacillus smithii]|nr:hypothetical protein BSM4216_2538 [Bacillus smithii]
MEHSPEVRPTGVLLPERFALLLAPSALHKAVSPPVFIRRYLIEIWAY